MADFERDIELLEEYKQWTVVHKNLPDTSPTAFMVAKAQEEAFEKLEQLEQWRAKFESELSASAHEAFLDIMEGTN